MRSGQEDTSAFNTHFQSGRFSHSRKAVAGDTFITKNGSIVNFLNGGAGDRNAYLPELEDGRFYVVGNIGTTNSIIVRDAQGFLKTSLLPSDTALLFASSGEWLALRGWAALGVFTNTINGLVPAPNSIVPGSLFLRDDGQWGQVQVVGIVDAFKFITDGTNTAIGSGPDTFRLRSSTNKIGITVTNNEAVFGDNANFTVLEAAVDHNALLNYVADQHVAHSGVTLTAGLGISGGGTIAASRTFDFAPSELTANAAPVLGDYAVMDLAAGGPRRTLFSAVNGILDHNALLNFVANKHIDHSGVSIVAGSGLTGGGDITASRTLALDINGLSADTLATGDFFPFFDISGGDNNKITFGNLTASIDHNSLLNYVADQHVAHSGVSITGTGLLTGGGAITANRTITFAAMANGTILSNISGGSAVPSGNSLSALIDAFLGSTRGQILTRGASLWQVLALGANTNVLKSNGTDVVWAAGGAGDLLAANNLSDVANVNTSLNNLFGVSVNAAQGWNATQITQGLVNLGSAPLSTAKPVIAMCAAGRLNSTEDLNTVVTDGHYFSEVGCTNGPVAATQYYLMVQKYPAGSGYVQQTAWDLTATGGTFTRNQAAGSWSPWVRIDGASYKLTSFTRVMSLASGNLAITGIGFKPRFAMFTTGISGGATCSSIGYSDVAGNTCLELGSTIFPQAAAGIQREALAGANYNIFNVASFDTDGFTISITKTGSPTLTMSVGAVCFR